MYSMPYFHHDEELSLFPQRSLFMEINPLQSLQIKPHTPVTTNSFENLQKQ